MDDTSNMSFTQSAPAGPAKKNNAKLIAIIIVVLILAGLGFLAFKNSKSKKEETKKEEVTPTEEPIPSEEPTETPSPISATPTKKPTGTVTPTTTSSEPATSAQTMHIQILNGTGETGVAGTAKDFLAGKGYKNLETGNAENNDFKNVTVKIKDSAKKFLDALVTDLKAKYTVESSTGTLGADSSFDAQVIIGK